MSKKPAKPVAAKATETILAELGEIKSEWDILCDLIDPPDVGWTPGWEPQPKQELAASIFERSSITLFGGSAGPGKTELLCELAIREMRRHANNRGLIVRRLYPSLVRTIIPRLKVKLHGLATWSEKTSSFTFPNGSVLECKSIQYVDDVIEFQGAEFGFIGIEEITEFAESQIEYLTSRLRAPADGITPRMFATANPGGRGHKWVKRWFIRPLPEDIHPLSPEEPVPYATWIPKPPNYERGDEVDDSSQTRAFVPATIEDNPKLRERDPGYEKRLQAIKDRKLREAMLKGDWDAIDHVEGALWSADDLDKGRASPDWMAENIHSWNKVIALDPSEGDAKGDAFGMSLCSRGSDGKGYVHWARGLKDMPRRKILQHAINVYHEEGCSVMIVERNHGGKWLVDAILGIDPTINVITVWASDGKRTRAEPVSVLFEYDVGVKGYKARIVGHQPELEELLVTTTFQPGDPSPDEIDAMVWGLTHLMLGTARQLREHDGNDGDERGYTR